MQLTNLIKYALSLTLTITALSTPLRAESKNSDSGITSLKTHNIGAGAGFLTGYGLTYRHWNQSKFGYQVAFLPVVRMNEEETFFNSSMGLIGLRSLHQTKVTNLFGYLGGHYNFSFQEYRGQYYLNSSSTNVDYTTEDFTNNIYGGGGIGIEFHFWNVNFSLMSGYAGHLRSAKTMDERIGYDELPQYKDSGKWKTSFELQPSIESALFYSF